jgi:CubicO group peptidase (beta-lactamase class C family)
MDIQGYIVEKLSGQPLPDFMQQHIFGPLKMKDTGFYVPKEKWDRFATLYEGDEKGKMVASSPDGRFARQPPCPRAAEAWSLRRRITCASLRCF